MECAWIFMEELRTWSAWRILTAFNKFPITPYICAMCFTV